MTGATVREGWVDRWRAMRFQILFGMLLVALVAVPVATGLALDRYLIDGSLLVSLLAAGLAGVGVGGGVAIVVLVGFFLVLRAAELAFGVAGALTASDLLIVIAAVLAGVAGLRTALRDGSMTRDRLYAASSVYLLAGFAFAIVYLVLDRLQPGSVVATARPDVPLDPGTAIYFSFVTLATLGYGDVVPVRPLARSVAICQAVGAQLFVTILIARLVSLQVRRRE